ncbi:hypothetical protein [Desulforhopalus sp. 52FAK]
MNKNTYNLGTEKKELSLEELDVLCRKCHHMHDEEILRFLARFFRRIATFFENEKQQPCHTSPR